MLLVEPSEGARGLASNSVYLGFNPDLQMCYLGRKLHHHSKAFSFLLESTRMVQIAACRGVAGITSGCRPSIWHPVLDRKHAQALALPCPQWGHCEDYGSHTVLALLSTFTSNLVLCLFDIFTFPASADDSSADANSTPRLRSRKILYFLPAAARLYNIHVLLKSNSVVPVTSGLQSKHI